MHVTLEQPATHVIKQAKVGFSWTTFFFGFFPALFRGDFKWFAIILLIDIFIAPFTVGIGDFIIGLVFAIIYNNIYIKDLLAKGWVPADDVSKNILISKGILLPQQ